MMMDGSAVEMEETRSLLGPLKTLTSIAINGLSGFPSLVIAFTICCVPLHPAVYPAGYTFVFLKMDVVLHVAPIASYYLTRILDFR